MCPNYPGGRIGVGLLLLRALVGLSALVNGIAYLSGGATIAFISWTAGVIAMLAGASLIAGLLTTVFGAVVAADVAAVTFSWLRPSWSHGIAGVLSAITLIVVATSVALLGPGAYSVDAQLFGMREIVITRSGPPVE
jgi:uncharacterized membrane protein YphA (DoxX/SURF4 family)